MVHQFTQLENTFLLVSKCLSIFKMYKLINHRVCLNRFSPNKCCKNIINLLFILAIEWSAHSKMLPKYIGKYF